MGTWEPPTDAVAEQIRSVAERLRGELEPLIDQVNDAIFASSPALASDAVLAAGTRASANANVTRWVTAMASKPHLRVSADAPPQALDLARDLVRRGMDRYALMTAYRVAQNVVWAAWMRCAHEEGLNGSELIAVLDTGSRSMFAFVDDVLSAIARQIENEHDELSGGALARRRETVALILDGAPISHARASARLGYALDRVHIAAIIWIIDEGVDRGDLERTAGAVAAALGAARPLSVSAGATAAWSWISGITPTADELRAAAAVAPVGVGLTLGSPLSGIGGFRDSHAEALAAQRLLMQSPNGPWATTYSDVQVVSLASADEARAAAFVLTTLGALRTADEELRDTVRIYLQQDCNAPRAAELLHTHRNTVLKRLARAEMLLPSPLTGRGLEVRLALELQRWRGE
jgi:DNA-binding PucR family transcriptional regulator